MTPSNKKEMLPKRQNTRKTIRKSMNSIYHFDDARCSIVITKQDLPAPWINYFSNGHLHAFVSQAGSGCLWWQSPLLFRLTHYRLQYLPIDTPGF